MNKCSVQIVSHLDSQSKFQMSQGGTSTWRLHTGLFILVIASPPAYLIARSAIFHHEFRIRRSHFVSNETTSIP